MKYVIVIFKCHLSVFIQIIAFVSFSEIVDTFEGVATCEYQRILLNIGYV